MSLYNQMGERWMSVVGFHLLSQLLIFIGIFLCYIPGIFAAIISVVTERPRSPDEYKQSLPQDLGLVHVTVEVHDHAPE